MVSNVDFLNVIFGDGPGWIFTCSFLETLYRELPLECRLPTGEQQLLLRLDPDRAPATGEELRGAALPRGRRRGDEGPRVERAPQARTADLGPRDLSRELSMGLQALETGDRPGVRERPGSGSVRDVWDRRHGGDKQAGPSPRGGER